MAKIIPAADDVPGTVPDGKSGLHPRNRHRGRYDFPQLVAVSPALLSFVSRNEYGDESIDFANPAAVRALNSALLKYFYDVAQWNIPVRYLCPPIPGRADYLHHVAELLAQSNAGEVPQGAAVRVLDVGVGANCIYPLIGRHEYGWSFVGVDVDREALASAQAIVDGNPAPAAAITLRRQSSSLCVFKGVVQRDELFDLTICNPPFHASLEEAAAGSQRKWKNLGKVPVRGRSSLLNFGGQTAELCCDGGEEGFIGRMVAESMQVRSNCLWFTTLVSRAASLPAVYRALKKAGVADSRTIEMLQGQKKSRIVAWTFFSERQRIAWFRQGVRAG